MRSESICNSPPLPFKFLPIPADDSFGPRGHDDPEIQVALSGRGVRWLSVDRGVKRVRTEPGMVEMYEAGYEINFTQWLGQQGECIAIQFPRDRMERLLGDDCPALRFTSRHEVFDQRVSFLCRELAGQFRAEESKGVLYVEGISIALVGLLIDGHVSGDSCAASLELSVQHRRLVEQYLNDDLGAPKSIEALARLTTLSPSQFAKRFKASFGASTHQYIVRRRLEAAYAELKASPARPIVDVAMAWGFSSQSHFSEAFRRQFGLPPAAFRRRR